MPIVLELFNLKAEENLDMTRTCYALTLQDSNWYTPRGDLLSIQNEPYVALLVSKLRKKIPGSDYLAIYADNGIYQLLNHHEVQNNIDALKLRASDSITACLQDVFNTLPDCDQVTWINSRQLCPDIEDIITASEFLAKHSDVSLLLSAAEDVTARFVEGKLITRNPGHAPNQANPLPFFDREKLVSNIFYTRSFFSLKENALSNLSAYNPSITHFYATSKPLFIDDLPPSVNDALLSQIIIAWLLSD
jgi:hypothetical protein